MEKEQPWGFHLIVDCAACDREKIGSRENILNFVRDLVVRIDMRAYGDPVVEHFATHDPNKAGFSLMQLIETSNITAHFVDLNGDCYFDIFSCKPYSVSVAVECIKEYFNPKTIKETFIERNA